MTCTIDTAHNTDLNDQPDGATLAVRLEQLAGDLEEAVVDLGAVDNTFRGPDSGELMATVSRLYQLAGMLALDALHTAGDAP